MSGEVRGGRNEGEMGEEIRADGRWGGEGKRKWKRMYSLMAWKRKGEEENEAIRKLEFRYEEKTDTETKT